MKSNPNNWKSCDVCERSFVKNDRVHTVLSGIFLNGEVVKYNNSLPDGIHIGDCCIHTLPDGMRNTERSIKVLNTSTLMVENPSVISPRERSDTSEDSV